MIFILLGLGLSGPELFIYILIFLVVLLFSLSIHEVMHGYSAYKLGDDTAYRAGRLTLNPLSHLDPIGTLMMLLAGFGWAKPVPVNFNRLDRFKNRAHAVRIVSLAGVAMNFIVAFVSFMLALIILFVGVQTGLIVGLGTQAAAGSNLIAYYAATGIALPSGGMILVILHDLFFFMYVFNLLLMAFNLIPLPPLDGYHFIETFLPYKIRHVLVPFERYSLYILLGLIMVGRFTGVSVLGWIIGVIQWPFQLLIDLAARGLLNLMYLFV